MVRLAMAVGFMTIVGFASYAIILLLKDHFQKKNQNLKTKPKTKKKND